MANWLRQAALDLGVELLPGPWLKSIALGATVIDGVTLGPLGETGCWAHRLAVAMGRTSGDGDFLRRMAVGHPGRSGEEMFANMCAGAAPPSDAVERITSNGATRITSDGAIRVTAP